MLLPVSDCFSACVREDVHVEVNVIILIKWDNLNEDSQTF